jgi:SAM-dependent methyltransferase
MLGTPARSWSDGYSTEVDYTVGCYPELAPSHLRFALLSRGVRPPRIDRPFTYLELGCGHGLSTCLLAAANPEGRFIAADFMPTHIVNARLLAEEAKLGNVEFFEDSFAELLRRDLPELDFIALHGVLSWIGPEARHEIVRLIRARLKPGGVVYASYNTFPGWAAFAPIRWLLRAHMATTSGTMADRLAQATTFLGQIEEAGAGYFKANPSLKAQLEKLAKQSTSYVIHEYLNEHWQPFFFPEIAELMGGAKLSFAAAATLTDNVESLCVSPALKRLCTGITDPLLAEAMQDFATNQRFRRDVYVRGKSKLGRSELREAHERTTYALITSRDKCDPEIRVPVGSLRLVPEQHGIVLDVLAAGPRTILELKADPRLAHLSPNQILNLVMVVCAAGYVRAGRPVDCHDRGPSVTAGFNAAVLQRCVRGEPLGWLASPVLGGPIALSMVEQALIAAETSQAADPIDAVCRTLASVGASAVVDGAPLGGEALARYLRTAQPGFRAELLPRLRSLGVV